ncbi:amino acid permease [Vagococcus intermedius]|uniref:Amino acid permease n=1 Tax=Vagococcus intermedius TaxID=2991418 RepID=A0AAF0CW13_9ENTE|nr:amino acid permease [Vagococcus intermedius]WEG74019.1 amino acid permease [Vagococcus intermedius]WEG76099.1 amino acid permease [Vagococcus intermedius]
MELERGLSNRHVQLIAIGGAIGTGLFLGAGKAIHLAGPSILLVYLIVGVFVFLIMRALGEVLLANLECHSFVELADKYLGKRMAFVTGWTYWFCWSAIAMADLTATGIYMRFWFPQVPQWLPAFIILIFLMFLNMMSVKLFGEIEFWLALIKIIAIIALILVGFYMIVTQFKTPLTVTSVKNIYSHGGFFPNGLSGFLLGFQLAVFSFVGVELVGLTAGETKDPEIVIPKAINNIPIRIILFYIGSLFVIMCIQPWDTIASESSPFVTVFSTIGIISAASIVNFVVLSSALSACNSAMFSTSRMLYGLGVNKHAPKSLMKLSSRKIPTNALFFSTIVLGITVVLNYFMPEGVFTLVTSISTACFLFIWAVILICHLKYLKETDNRVTFKLFLAPYTNYITLAFLLAIVFVLLAAPETRIALIVSPIWFAVLVLIFNRYYAEGKAGDNLD